MSTLQRARRQQGFSLVEILVGMLVGLVVTIIIYQVVATYEGVKRTTTTGADTQQNGIFSLTTVERDVRAAGWGMPTAAVMPCTTYFTYYSTGAASGSVPNFPNTPVRITDGGNAAGASDSITMLWGSSVRRAHGGSSRLDAPRRGRRRCAGRRARRGGLAASRSWPVA